METESSSSDPTSTEALIDSLAQVSVSSSVASSSSVSSSPVLTAEEEAARAYQKMMAKEEHYKTYWAKKRAIGREKQKEKKRIAKEIKEKELKEKAESEGVSLVSDGQQQQQQQHQTESVGETSSSLIASGSNVQVVGKPKPTQRGKRKRMEKRGFLLESFVHNRPEIVIDLSFIDPLRLPQPPSSLTPNSSSSSNDNLEPTLQSSEEKTEEKEKRSFLSIKDIRHVIRQVHHCYGYLRKVEKPLPIHLTSLNDRLLPYFQKYDGFETWLFVRHNESYSKIFESSRIVYLTPDSPHPLLEFEEESVYVIGGLDDHNKQANATLDKASSEGIRTARLPLAEFCPDRIANKSLTINQGLYSLPFLFSSV